MKKLSFSKYGLSQSEVEQMRKFGILPDKRTLKNLISAYNIEEISSKNIELLQSKLTYEIPKPYIDFLLQHNGGVPSKVRVKGTGVVINYFLALKSPYRFNSLLDMYLEFEKQGLPIARTPSGDSLILSPNVRGIKQKVQ